MRDGSTSARPCTTLAFRRWSPWHIHASTSSSQFSDGSARSVAAPLHCINVLPHAAHARAKTGVCSDANCSHGDCGTSASGGEVCAGKVTTWAPSCASPMYTPSTSGQSSDRTLHASPARSVSVPWETLHRTGSAASHTTAVARAMLRWYSSTTGNRTSSARGRCKMRASFDAARFRAGGGSMCTKKLHKCAFALCTGLVGRGIERGQVPIAWRSNLSE